MCGIILAESFDGNTVNNLVMNQFEAQKHRGQEGFGFFDKTRNRLFKTPKERKLLSQLRNYPSSSILMHHRFPTSTMNRRNACHPFSTRDFFDTNYVLIHNGHISNSQELKPEHEALGINYTSERDDDGFNDSEALLWDVALYLEGQQDELKAYGNIAFICMAIPSDGRKSSKLFFGRNSNPIKMQLDDTMIMLSSEGDGELVDAQTLYSYNYRTKKLDSKHLTIPSYKPYDASEWEGRWDRGWDNTCGQQSIVPYEGNYGNYPDNYQSNDSDTLFDDEVDYDLDGFLVLPENEDYSYEAIISEVKQELVFERNDGKLLNVKDTIADRVYTYLEAADGVYKDAYALLKYDIKTYEDSLKDDYARGVAEDIDLVLEIDVLNACRTTLYTSPFWNSPNSIDPGFFEGLSEGVRKFLSGATGATGATTAATTNLTTE